MHAWTYCKELYFFIKELDNLLDDHFGIRSILRTPTTDCDSNVTETPTAADDQNDIADDSFDIEAFYNERISALVRENEVIQTNGSAQASVGENSSSTNDVDGDECPDLNLQTISQKISKGCGCKKCCLEQFQENVIYDNILNVSEMDKDQREMVIMSAFDVKSKDSTSTKRGSRKQFHCTFRFNGKEICRDAFKVIYNVGEVVLRNLLTHVKTQGITPRSHGNKGRKPHHAFSFSDITLMVTFIRNYADEHGLPLPAPERGRDSIPPIYLPSSDTKTSVHKKYQEACSSTQQRAAKYHVEKWSRSV